MSVFNRASMSVLVIAASIAFLPTRASATSVATDTPTSIANDMCTAGTTAALSRAATEIDKAAALGAAMARASATPPNCGLSAAAITTELNNLKAQFPGSSGRIQAAYDSALAAGPGSGDGADKPDEELLPTGDVGEPVESSKK